MKTLKVIGEFKLPNNFRGKVSNALRLLATNLDENMNNVIKKRNISLELVDGKGSLPISFAKTLSEIYKSKQQPSNETIKLANKIDAMIEIQRANMNEGSVVALRKILRKVTGIPARR